MSFVFFSEADGASVWNSISRTTTAPKPCFYTYNALAAGTDTLSTISASGYFNQVADQIDTNDIMYVVATDGTGLYRFTSAQGDTPVTITAFDATPSGSIVNADISASAAIAFSKLAALNSANILVGNGSNVATSVAMSGDTTISNAGVVTIGLATVTPAKMSTTANSRLVSLPVSFVTANQGTMTVYFNSDVTVNKVRALVTSALSGSDDGTITCKNNAGSSMSGGVVTLVASSPVASEATATPTTNNTFTSGQKMQLTVAKTTTGGAATVFIEYTVTG